VATPCPRSEWRKTLERQEPQESIVPDERRIPVREVTNSGEVPNPEDGRSAPVRPVAGKACVDVAADYGGNTFPVDGRAS